MPQEPLPEFSSEHLKPSRAIKGYTYSQYEIIETWMSYHGMIDGLVELPDGNAYYARMINDDHTHGRVYAVWDLDLHPAYDDLPEDVEEIREWLEHPNVDICGIITRHHYNVIFPLLHGNILMKQ